MHSWECFQRNILSLLSERLLKSSTETIKGAFHSPGPKSEGDAQNKLICIVFVPWQGNKIGTIRNVHIRQVCDQLMLTVKIIQWLWFVSVQTWVWRVVSLLINNNNNNNNNNHPTTWACCSVALAWPDWPPVTSSGLLWPSSNSLSIY